MEEQTSSEDVLSPSDTKPPANRGMTGRNKPERGSSKGDLAAISS